jgi:transposase-like protein
MGMSVQQFRLQVRQLAHGRAARGIRYPVALREAAVALGRTRLGRGRSLARIAKELGVSEPTLTGWLRPRGAGLLHPVTVAPAPPPPRAMGAPLVLTTAQGVRVEGLDRDTLVAVLQALV